MFKFWQKKPKDSEEKPSQEKEEAVSSQPVVTPAPQQTSEVSVSNEPQPASMVEVSPPESTESEPQKSPGMLGKFHSGLNKTRVALSKGLLSLTGKQALDGKAIDTLEESLLVTDMGIEVTQKVIEALQDKALWERVTDDPYAVRHLLADQLVGLLRPFEQPLAIGNAAPFVIMMVGVNGAGKTTTIGKLAKRFQQQGKSVMLAAGDTFRAAAVEQLQVWGERNNVQVIAQKTGADSAAVAFDAVQSATAKKIDVLIVDTAGRLHTQHNLMQELEKVKRVIGKANSDAPHEVMLVLDATLGQNSLQQAKQFNQCVGVSGLVLTKLDGTAKGGIVFALAEQLKLPLWFVGVGEGIDDLQVFNAEAFVEALLAD